MTTGNFANFTLTLMRQNQGDADKLDKLSLHLPLLVTFADHEKPLPWTAEYQAVLVFADISGFTALCEKYSADQQSGIDELARILNNYLGELVQEIIGSGGDVIKFAGDAILSVWRINEVGDLPETVNNVINCCLGIQEKCAAWNTESGVSLTVKLGISAGDFTLTFIGNDVCRYFVEMGSAISEVNKAESFCKSGYIVISPKAWAICKQTGYDFEMLEDNKHVRILGKAVISGAVRRFSLRVRRLSLQTPQPEERPDVPQPIAVTVPEEAIDEGAKDNNTTVLDRLRKVVKQVTSLHLEEKLKLFISTPVLKKLSAGQPLEYLSEMRLVSVMFMNLILDEEADIAQLLQEVFEVIHMEIKSMGGCLNKVFLFDKGCTFLVIFGIPGFKHSEDSTRALQCSSRVKKILDSVIGVLQVSIGVTTGDSFCGVVGHKRRHEYSDGIVSLDTSLYRCGHCQGLSKVIGRKVNMAARLMMNYPDKVTCDDETYKSTKIASRNFERLITKRMKGLRNVGVIREFRFNEDEETGLENTIPFSEFPILGREKEIDLFTQELTKLQEENQSHRHIVFVGAACVGKTRLLDHCTLIAAKENIKFLTFDLTTNDVKRLYFVARHILKVLLSAAGYSQEVDSEPVLLQNLRERKLLGFLHSFSDVIGVKLKSPDSLTTLTVSEEILKGKRREIYSLLIQNCLEKIGPTLVVLDDMRSCDPKSWEYLNLLSEAALIMIVMGVRPIIIDEPTCPEAHKFLENRKILTKEVDLMESRQMTPLACQILDVQQIQRELDLYLKMLSHGIPKWTERLIQHMYESKQLVIVEEDHKPPGISTFSPHTDLLNKKPSKERRAANVDRRKHAINFETSLQIANAEENSGNTSDMLGFLGYVQPKNVAANMRSSRMTKVKLLKRVAILAEGINTRDLKIPEAMTNMVTARLDSMRAMDQLVVKCCAVIDTPFSLDIVKAVLQKSNIFQVSLSMKRLFTNGTFECTEYRRARKLSYLDDSAHSQNLCYCQNQSSSDSDHMCKKLSFRNFLLQTMACNVLMPTQRNEIHVLVADYLLSGVKENRKYLPFYLFSTTSSSTTGNKKASREDEVMPFLNVTDVYEDISQTGNTADYVQHLKNGFNNERKTLLSALIPVYGRVKGHLYNANEYGRLLYLMVEASAVSLFIENTSHGLIFAEDAESVLDKLIKERPDIHPTNLLYTTACIHRLSAQALRMSGRSEMGAVHLRKTSSLLKLDHPSNRLSYLFKILKYDKYPTNLLQLVESTNYTKSNSKADRYILELINCLIEFCHLHTIRGDVRMLHLDILRLLTVLRATSPHPLHILEACQLLLELYRLKKRFDVSYKLELQLFSMIVYFVEFVSYQHIEKLVDCFKRSIIISLDRGMIHKALVVGRAAESISRLFQDEVLIRKTLSTLGMATILNNNLDESTDILTKLKESCLIQNKRKERVWYFNFAMEIMLIRGYCIETFPKCLSTLSLYLKDYDVVHGENVARFYSAMCIATWYCRQSEWKHGQRWFDYWDYYQPEQISLLSLLARLKKLECMLLSLCLSLDNDVKVALKRLEPEVIQEIKLFQTALKEIPGIMPRFFHHLAYYYLLKQKRMKAKKYLNLSMKISLEQGNKLDWCWAMSTWKSWHDPDLAENVSQWKKLVENHSSNSFDWTKITDSCNIYYPFPLPRNFVYFSQNTMKF